MKTIFFCVILITILFSSLQSQSLVTMSISFNGKQSEIKKEASNKATLNGNVTYYLNNDFVDKPDNGAKVYLRLTDTLNGKTSVIHNFGKAKTHKYLWNAFKDDKDEKFKQRSIVSYQKLEKLNANTEEGYKKLDNDARKEVLELDLAKNVFKTTVDASGNYSISVEPGLYEIIIISKGRIGEDVAESMGRINSNVIYLKGGETASYDYYFGL